MSFPTPQRSVMARVAQHADPSGAARPKVPKLSRNAELATAVQQRLDQRWWPHAISADLRVQGLRVCAETVYRACEHVTECVRNGMNLRVCAETVYRACCSRVIFSAFRSMEPLVPGVVFLRPFKPGSTIAQQQPRAHPGCAGACGRWLLGLPTRLPRDWEVQRHRCIGRYRLHVGN